MDTREYAIGDFSLITRMTVKTLRFYHDKGLLEPSRVDAVTGYRYYDAGCAERARIVSTLRHLDFSVDEVRTMLATCRSDEDALGFLRRKASDIRRKIARYREMENELTEILRVAEDAGRSERQMSTERKTLESLEALTVRFTGRYDQTGSRIGLLYKTAGRWAAGGPFTLYWDGEYKEDGADIEVCLPLRPGSADKAAAAAGRVKGSDTLTVRNVPGGDVVSVVYKGPYDTIGDGYRLAMDAVEERQLKTGLPLREIYIKGPGMIFRGNPEKYLTEICLPVTE